MEKKLQLFSKKRKSVTQVDRTGSGPKKPKQTVKFFTKKNLANASKTSKASRVSFDPMSYLASITIVEVRPFKFPKILKAPEKIVKKVEKVTLAHVRKIEKELDLSLGVGGANNVKDPKEFVLSDFVRDKREASTNRLKKLAGVVQIESEAEDDENDETLFERETRLIVEAKSWTKSKDFMDRFDEAQELLDELKQIWNVNVEIRDKNGNRICCRCHQSLKTGDMIRLCKKCYGRERRWKKILSQESYRECVNCHKVKFIDYYNRCRACTTAYRKQLKQQKEQNAKMAQQENEEISDAE